MVRQVNERAMVKGMKLKDENGGVWEIEQILYADGKALVVKTKEHLHYIVSEFEKGVTVWF